MEFEPSAMLLTDRKLADLVDTIAGADGVRIDAGNAQRSDGQVAVISIVRITTSNIPT